MVKTVASNGVAGGIDLSDISAFVRAIWHIMDRHPAVGNVNGGYGVIYEDGHLEVDGFEGAIWQAGDYDYAYEWALADPMCVTALAGTPPHSHDVPRPDALSPAVPGKQYRVKVDMANAPVRGGQGVTPCVTHIVVRSARRL